MSRLSMAGPSRLAQWLPSFPRFSRATQYISSQFLRRFFFVLLGFVTLVQLFDLFANADDIVRNYGTGLEPMVRYTVYRLPAMVSLAFPFALLISTLMTLMSLSQNNEIMAFKSVGMSFYRILLGFLPAGLALAALQFVVTDQIAPRSLHALSVYQVEANQTRPGGAHPAADPGDTVWIRDRDMLIRIGRVLRNGTLLLDVEIVRRDQRGIMTERDQADRAQYNGKKWVLGGVSVLLIGKDNRQTTNIDEMAWDTTLRPSDFADQSVPPNQFSAADLLSLTKSAGIGSRPVQVYETWLQKRLAVPVLCLLMILLAAPVSQASVRGGGTALRMTAGVGLGFLFFVADGLSTAMGETGSLAPFLAAWLPLAVFGSIGTSVLLRVETV